MDAERTDRVGETPGTRRQPQAEGQRDCPSGDCPSGDGPSVDALAAAALSVLAARVPKPPDARFAARIETFCDALVSSDDTKARLYAARLIAYGITTEQIYERYIPAAARRLGERWVEDSLSFVDVTMGSARLQELTRNLEGRFSDGDATIPLGHSVLIVVPSFEQHTLGAFIAGGGLRRLGLWVHMAVSAEEDALARLASSQRFAAIGFSAASRRSLDPLRKLVERLRISCDFEGPIAIGGNITRLGPEVKDYTGADLATEDPRSFARLFQEKPETRLIHYTPTILGN